MLKVPHFSDMSKKRTACFKEFGKNQNWTNIYRKGTARPGRHKETDDTLKRRWSLLKIPTKKTQNTQKQDKTSRVASVVVMSLCP